MFGNKSILKAILDMFTAWRHKVDTDSDDIPDNVEQLKDSLTGDYITANELIHYGAPVINIETDESINKGDPLYIKPNGYVGVAKSGIVSKVEFISLETKDGSQTVVSIRCILPNNIAPINTIFNSSDIGSHIYLSDINQGTYILKKTNSIQIKVGKLIDIDKILFLESDEFKYIPGDIALTLCGKDINSNPYNNIEYFYISILSNAQDFGDYSFINRDLAQNNCSNSVFNKGIASGGRNSSSATSYINSINYIIISNIGSNSQDFGDLTIPRYASGTCSNGINNRGVIAGGVNSSVVSSIDFISINSNSNASHFGYITNNRAPNGLSNLQNNMGVFVCGNNGVTRYNIIDYVNISNIGNAQSFGQATYLANALFSTSNGIYNRGIYGGGQNSTTTFNNIEFITITTPSNGTDFGDLSYQCLLLGGNSNAIKNRATTSEGWLSSTIISNIDYVTIVSLSNALHFGSMISAFGFSATANNG